MMDATSPVRRTYGIDVTDLTEEEVAQLHAAVQETLAEMKRDRPAAADIWTPPLPQAADTGWTSGHVALLLKLLRDAGKTVQATSIESCDAAGFIPRELIYQIGGYEPGRRLNRWTLPIDTAVETLKEQHGLPEDAADPVAADYPASRSYVAARGYRVAAEVSALLRGEQRLMLPGKSLLPSDVITDGDYAGAVITRVINHEKVELKMADGETSTVRVDHAKTWAVWREIDPDLVVDTGSDSTEESEKFFSDYQSRMAADETFTSAVIVQKNGTAPALLLTTNKQRQLALTQCNAGYHGTGPDATVNILTAAGFNRNESARAVYSPERETTPIELRKN